METTRFKSGIILGYCCLNLVLFTHCKGKHVETVKPTKELEVPKELEKAYEIKDVEQVFPQDSLSLDTDATASERVKATKAGSKKSKTALGAPSRRPERDPIIPGEKIWMDVTWLSTKAGEFLLEVLPFKAIKNRKVYHLKGTAKTSDLFSLVYKAEDWVESFIDFEGWYPHKFILHGDETKHLRNHLELFDHQAKKQYVHIYDYRIHKKEVHEEKGYKDLIPFSQDALSALYYVRTQKIDVGNVIKFPMTTGGNQWETEVHVIKKEDVSTKMGYRKAIKTKVLTKFKGVLQQQGDSFIWYSDDELKAPLRFEAKVRIGWVSGIVKKIESPLLQLNAQTASEASPVRAY